MPVDVLEDLRRMLDEPLAAPHDASTSQALLDAEAVDALYAWGVCCYEAGHHDAADVVLRFLCARQPGSVRNLKALAANHLARGDLPLANRTYAFAHTFSRAASELAAADDAELLYFQAQTALLLGDLENGRQHLLNAQALTRAQPEHWPELSQWIAPWLEALSARGTATPAPLPAGANPTLWP